MKFQIYLFELSSTLFWCSAADVLVFLLAFCVFFTDIPFMGPLFFFTMHLARGGFGGFMCLKLPNFDLMMKETKIPPSEKIGFGQI
jgi:hypothetical protein